MELQEKKGGVGWEMGEGKKGTGIEAELRAQLKAFKTTVLFRIQQKYKSEVSFWSNQTDFCLGK